MPGIETAIITAIAYVGASATAVVAGTATLAQIATVAAVGIGAGVGGMAAAKALTPEIGSQGAAVQWVADPDEPLRFAFGRVGVKGSIKDAGVYGADRMYVSFACTVSAAGPIKRFVNFRAGDHYMSFDGAGNALNEPYRGEMWLSTRLGMQPDTALTLPTLLKNGVSFPGWNSTRKMSGSAAYLVTLGENSKRSAYDGKIPAFLAVIEGLFCYDPRLDSTYPGGMGNCRLNDPSTWVWSQNPILFALKWALGLWEGPTGQGAPQVDYQVGGIGAKVEGIRVSTAVEAANIADANGWTSAAWPSTDDNKAQVLDGFLKAGGARYAEIAGQMAFIHRAAPRAPVFTVRARDTAGPVEIDTASSKLNRINTLLPRYWSEAHEWEMTTLPPVTATEWQIEDGQGVPVKRTRGADYTFVPDPKQARELASLEISNSREGIKGRVPLRPYMDPEPGNTFIFDEPDFALSNLKCIVLDVEDDTENDTVVVTFETETDGKYPYAYGQTASPPPAQELSPYDPTLVSPPLPGDWVITPRPPGPGGTQLPGFDLTGIVSNATATAIIVEHGPTAEGPWTTAYQGPPTVTTIPIDGLQSGETYFIAIQYQRNQNYSERAVYGPFTAPTLTAGISDETLDQIIEEVSGQIDGDIAAGKKALDRSRDNALLILQNAKNALDGTLKEEKDRETQTGDLQGRIDIGFLIDPVAKTGIIRSEVKVEGLNETLVQVNTRLVARDADNALQTAQVAIDAQAYTNDKISLATANLVTAAQMGTAISGAVLSMQAYADDEIAQATAGLVAVAQMNTAISASSLALQSWTDSRISEATAGLATTAAVASSIAAADLALRSWTDGQISTATAGLAAVSQVDAKIDSATLQIEAWTNGQIGNATATLATKSELDGVSATAGLAINTATTADGKINAAINLLLNVDGLISGVFSYNDGVTATINFLSSAFNLYSTGSGAQTSYIDGVWYVLDPDLGTRTMWGKPFGGANKLQWWTGPNSVPIFGETKANAYVFISMTAPRIGGSDFPGGSALAATASPDLALGSAAGGGVVTSETVTINVTGPGAASAIVRWVKTEETGGTMEVYPSGKTAYFRGTVPPGGMIRALYLAVVSYGGQSVTVLVDVQLTDST